MWMRGGTSKGAFFLAEHLPADPATRDAFLLRVMGSPDPRQIDGMGGADPLTSKVAVVRASERPGVDVDYLFLQVFVDQALVSDAQNCGNMLSAVAPFVIERGLVDASDGRTRVTIFMENTGQTAVATVQTPNGGVTYVGETEIDGVPGSHAPVAIEFHDTAGSSCGSLLPTTRVRDRFDEIDVTLIDNGMPCVVIAAEDVGATGYEDREALDSNAALKSRLESIRLKAGPAMNLGDVREKSVPKMMLVAPPAQGGALSVRSFIPHRAHASLGVLGAVTVATAALLEGSVAASMAKVEPGRRKNIDLEHPTGTIRCEMELGQGGSVASAAVVRTARKLMDGEVFA